MDSGRPGAAIGVDGRGIGQHSLHPVDQVLDVVHAGQDLERRGGRDERPEQRAVGAHVGRGLDLHAEDPVIGVEGEFGLGDVVAAHDVGEEGLGALAGPLHRPAEQARRPRRHRVLGVEERLHAEAAADVGREDAHLGSVDLERTGQDVGEQPAALRAGVQRDRARGGIEVGDRRARLDRVRDQPVVDHAQPGDVGRLGERGVDGGAIAVLPVERQIVGHVVVHQWLAGLGCGFGIGHRGQRFVVDRDQLGRVLGLARGLGDHERDIVADMAYPIDAQHRTQPVLALRAVTIFHGDAARQGVAAGRRVFRAGDHRQHPGRSLRRVDLDGLDPGMGLRRTHDGNVCLAVEIDIVGIAPGARDETLILDPAH